MYNYIQIYMHVSIVFLSYLRLNIYIYNPGFDLQMHLGTYVNIVYVFLH